MTYGIKISKAGVNVGTAGVTDCIFNSDYNSIKIVQQGTLAVSVGTADTYGTVTHGLGYTPAYMAFSTIKGSASYSYPLNSYDLFTGAGEGFTAKAGTGNLIFKYTSAGTAFSTNLYYYIFADPLS